MNICKSTEYTICCQNCGETDFIQDCDGEYKLEDTPSNFFKRLGWREIKRVTLCPNCIKNGIK